VTHDEELKYSLYSFIYVLLDLTGEFMVVDGNGRDITTSVL